MFRTELQIEPSAWKVSIRDKILSIGSCFAVNTGQKLLDFKMDALVNPFGVVYNPASVFHLLGLSLSEGPLETDLFIENQGLSRHYNLHSDISAHTRQGLEAAFALKRNLANTYLNEGKVLIITLGTASVFRHRLTGAIVTNCHKMPADHFTRHTLEVEDICLQFHDLYRSAKEVNPGLRFIITISPVRHLRDTLPASQLSKSILRVAVDHIVNELNDVSYFPAYEVMMDDLRDYRYYASDMLHPSDLAVNYIWGKFKEAYFDDDTRDFINGWSKIRKSLGHRPFNPGSQEHRQFIVKTIGQLELFKEVVDITAEKAFLEQQLNG